MTVSKLYVQEVNLLTQDSANILHHLKSGFKGTINWNKYLSKVKTLVQNRYLD